MGTLLVFAASVTVCRAANKDIIHLQRDVALLREDMRALQQALHENLAEINVLLNRSLKRLDDVATGGAVRNENAAANWEQLNRTVATLATKLDRAATEYLATKDAIAGVNARLSRLELKLEDLSDTVDSLRSPRLTTALESPPPGMTAESLFQSAIKDQMAGRLDLALREYEDYLRYYGDTELAASSQFHIGEIHYRRGELGAAIDALSAVLKQYPESGKAPDALLVRALALAKQGRLAASREDLQLLIEEYSQSDAARRATIELKRLAAANGTSSRSRSRP